MENDLEADLKALENPEQVLDALRNLRKNVTQPQKDFPIKKFLKKIIPLLKHEDELTRRLSWQTLHNLCAANSHYIQETMEELSMPFIVERLTSEVSKTSNVIFALILLNYKNCESNVEVSLDLLKVTTTKVSENDYDFAVLLLKHILININVENHMDNLDSSQRVTIFDLVQNIQENDELNEHLLNLVVKEFKKKSGNLLMTFNKNEIDPVESSKLLEILSKSSSNEVLQKVLQKDMSLLIDVLYVLRMMHDAGKSGEIPNLKPVTSMETIDAKIDTESPAYGFKCNLIRLIGNLSHKHKENQDQVRDCSGIELLLDCSPLDAKNPMITQWVIFAIHNLCENNLDNQKVIASIDKKGQMDKDKLRELGIDVFDEK